MLCCSGHDPVGGAGIHADIEAVAANGAHALTVITAQTVQDTDNVSRVVPVAPILIAAQIEALLADCRIGAIKIGLLGDAAQIPVLLKAARDTGAPLVFDPVLRAGGGTQLVNPDTWAALVEDLLPAVEVVTPNAGQARRRFRSLAPVPRCAGFRAGQARAPNARSARCNRVARRLRQPGSPRSSWPKSWSFRRPRASARHTHPLPP